MNGDSSIDRAEKKHSKVKVASIGVGLRDRSNGGHVEADRRFETEVRFLSSSNASDLRP